MGILGIRKEDKSRWERRAPLAPDQVEVLRQAGIEVLVESSPHRIYGDGEYAQGGGHVVTGLERSDVILGIKEVPVARLLPGKTYVFFSHTIKGQAHNMPMLRRLMELGCTLIDYERIVDGKGRRLVFFGYHAGVAGMIDTLWLLGRRLHEEGIETPLAGMRQAFGYEDSQDACRAISLAGEAITREGLPLSLVPLVVGFAGYGNVSRGAQFVLGHLPVRELSPEELPGLFASGSAADSRTVYKVVFKEQHQAERIDGGPFALDDYYGNPQEYRGIFERWVPWLSVLVNCIYWDERYPRLLTRAFLKQLHVQGRLRLRAVGDITCDIDGSIEMTTEATNQERPALRFDPAADTVTREVSGPGVGILAVDNLPAEVPRDATRHFGESLKPYLGALAALDPSFPFESAPLPPEIRRAVIVWNGRLTPEYEYLEEHLRLRR